MSGAERIDRYLPQSPLPPYSYVTGLWPHPLGDPLGHSYGCAVEKARLPPESEWRTCEPHLYAVDLFNHGYYWEAHETWEALWHAAGRRGPTAYFFQALIKLAAAGVKAREGRSNGVRRHLLRAAELLAQAAAELPERNDRYWGLAWAELHDLIAKCNARVPQADDIAPVAVQRIWDAELRLG